MHKDAEEVAKSRCPDTMKKLVLEAVKRANEMFAQPRSQKPTSTPTQDGTIATKAEAKWDDVMEVDAKEKRPAEPTEASVQSQRRAGARARADGARASQVDSDSDHETPRSRSPVPKPEQAVTETEDKSKNSAGWPTTAGASNWQL